MGVVRAFGHIVTDHIDLDSPWMAPWDAGGTLGGSCRPGMAVWRAVLCSVVRLSRRPVFFATDYLRLFRSLGRTCVLDLNVGQTKIPTIILKNNPQMDFLRSPLSPGDVGVLASILVALMNDTSRKRGNAGNCHSPGVDSMTAMGFPQMSSTPGEICAVELDFPRASFPPGQSCVEERDYVKPTLLAGSPVCAWTVTGSLLFGSPHRRVRGCFRLLFLFFLPIDGLDVVRWSTDVQHDRGSCDIS